MTNPYRISTGVHGYTVNFNSGVVLQEVESCVIIPNTCARGFFDVTDSDVTDIPERRRYPPHSLLLNVSSFVEQKHNQNVSGVRLPASSQTSRVVRHVRGKRYRALKSRVLQ